MSPDQTPVEEQAYITDAAGTTRIPLPHNGPFNGRALLQRLVITEGLQDGPYPAMVPVGWDPTSRVWVNREVAEQIVRETRTADCAIRCTWSPDDSLRIVWAAAHDGVGGTELITPYRNHLAAELMDASEDIWSSDANPDPYDQPAPLLYPLGAPWTWKEWEPAPGEAPADWRQMGYDQLVQVTSQYAASLWFAYRKDGGQLAPTDEIVVSRQRLETIVRDTPAADGITCTWNPDHIVRIVWAAVPGRPEGSVQIAPDQRGQYRLPGGVWHWQRPDLGDDLPY